MTPNEFKALMSQIAATAGDCERDHGAADDLMCQALRELGYGEGVDIFEALEKWYA